VCVLLGDGRGGVFFLVSSRSVSYWSRRQWGGIFFGVRSEGIFLWGPFRGYISLLACLDGIFFGVHSEGIFLCLLLGLLLEEGVNVWRVKLQAGPTIAGFEIL
jgi:hypothetical protein